MPRRNNQEEEVQVATGVDAFAQYSQALNAALDAARPYPLEAPQPNLPPELHWGLGEGQVQPTEGVQQQVYQNYNPPNFGTLGRTRDKRTFEPNYEDELYSLIKDNLELKKEVAELRKLISTNIDTVILLQQKIEKLLAKE